MGIELPGLGGQAVVAALVVVTNLAPMAGLDGLADSTGAAACALATGSDRPDSACRAGAQATDRAAADTATDSAAAAGDDRADRDTATAPTGVVADRRPADCPITSPAPDGQGADHDPPASSADTAEHARATTTTVDEARDENGGWTAGGATPTPTAPTTRTPPARTLLRGIRRWCPHGTTSRTGRATMRTPPGARGGPPRRRPRCRAT